jgi:hypothetical protein
VGKAGAAGLRQVVGFGRTGRRRAWRGGEREAAAAMWKGRQVSCEVVGAGKQRRFVSLCVAASSAETVSSKLWISMALDKQSKQGHL